MYISIFIFINHNIMENISKNYKRYLKCSHTLNNEIFNKKKYFSMMIGKNKAFINTYLKTIGIYDKTIKKCIINATINSNITDDYTDTFDNMIKLFQKFEDLFFSELYKPYYQNFLNKENIDISCNLFTDNIIQNCHIIALYNLYNKAIDKIEDVISQNINSEEYYESDKIEIDEEDIEIIEDIDEHIISKYLPDNKTNNYLIFSIVGFIVLFIILLIVLIILAVKYHKSKIKKN